MNSPGHALLSSDHASLVVDLDGPGTRFDAGWTWAESRIAERLRN